MNKEKRENQVVFNTRQEALNYQKTSKNYIIYNNNNLIVIDNYSQKINKKQDLQGKSKDSLENYTSVGMILGEGHYGKVFLFKSNLINFYYALKVFKKSKIKEMKHYDYIMSELKILFQIEFPFILKLYNVFQDELFLYFKTEFVDGGDLVGFLKHENYITEKTIKFIIAQVGLIIEYLHSRNILYRDLKPENILIDNEGYLKLIDFGLSVNLSLKEEQRTKTFCGTPEFMPPEVLRSQDYGTPFDMWSLGILFYELYFGKTPFADKNVSNLYKKIIFNEVDISLDKYKCKLSSEAENLLKGLLYKNKYERFSINDFLSHSFFENFDFNSVINKSMLSPLKPYSTKNCYRMTEKILECEESCKSSDLQISNSSTKQSITSDIYSNCLSPINQMIPFQNFDDFQL